MPREDLLPDLQALLDAYQVQRRTTDALIARLRRVNEPLNQARRALSDYATQPISTLSREQIAEAQQALEAIRFKETVSDVLLADLRRESKLLATIIGALRDTMATLTSDVTDVVRLDRAVQVLKSARLPDERLTAMLPALGEALDTAQEQLSFEFGASLRDRLAALGLNLGGRPPQFQVGRFEITVSFLSRTAALHYGKIAVATGVKLSLDTLIKVYQEAARNIEGRDEDGQRWIDQLYTAWQIARRKSEKGAARVSIVDCYYELVLLRQSRSFNSSPSKRSFTDYTRAQFVHDLDQFTQRFSHQGQRVALHTATKTQAENANRSLWVITGAGPHDGQYVADLEFVANTLF
ncbi:MAG: hypothetical protein LC130_03710 [Bryobacterales bacterium]|nr:hypothetical protein [Bryobacterales bacterium]